MNAPMFIQSATTPHSFRDRFPEMDTFVSQQNLEFILRIDSFGIHGVRKWSVNTDCSAAPSEGFVSKHVIT